MGSVEMNRNVMMKETVQLGMVGSRVAVAGAIRAKIQLGLLQTIPFS